MSKHRVHELAKELNKTSKELIEKLESMGIIVKNHMSSLEDEEAEMLKQAFAPVKKEHKVSTSDNAEAIIDEYEEKIGKFAKSKKSKKKEKKEKKEKKKESEFYTPQEVKYENEVIVPEIVNVGELAEILKKSPNELIVKLMALDIMATVNQELDFETAELIATDFGISISKEYTEEEASSKMFEIEDRQEDLEKRAAVVTVMGHVDHGKTSLLDAIRNTNVIGGEAGGITQHIGASEVVYNGEKIVFLDTPGHEAFTSLRARGAKVTDIAILVVAADDGIMPQTVEAINHAKAADIPIIVAMNKIDVPNANPDKVKQGLSDQGLLIEEWGGDIICVPVSAKFGDNIDQLLEMVLLVTEMLELKANSSRPGIGTIIEAKMEKGRGPVATALVENGTVKIGDAIIAGTTYGRVRAMYNFLGKKVKEVGPASSIEITGLNEVPTAGDKFYVTQDDRQARLLVEKKEAEARVQSIKKSQHVTLEDLFDQIKDGEMKDLNLIIKADAHGSIEALKGSLLKLSNEEVRVKIIHANVGTISESDILLASASNAIIIGFNVRPNSVVAGLADREGVELKTYSIIYEAISDVSKALIGMLDPEYKEVVLGKIQVRETFKVPKIGLIAGGYVIEGKVTRNSEVRVIRDGIVIHEGKISSLKRFKDDAKEVNHGYECGIGIEKFNDIKENDEIEAFIIEEIKRV